MTSFSAIYLKLKGKGTVFKMFSVFQFVDGTEA